MPDFTITGVGDEERFSTQNGEFVSYQVEFEGSQGRGTAFHKRKASSPVPSVGEVIDAELVQKNGKTELKRIWKQDGGGSNGFSGKSPDQQKSIVRQHSEHMAILFMATVQKEGVSLPGDTASEKLDALRRIVDWFVEDAGT